MTARYSWWYQQLVGRTWVIYTVCGFVALLVVPYWLAFAGQGRPDGVPTRTATVTSVANPSDKDHELTVTIDGVALPQSVEVTGDITAGDHLQVWRSEGIWHTGRERSMTGGLILTGFIALITGGTSYAVHRRASATRRDRSLRALAARGAQRG